MIYVILGMHKSGTTLLANILHSSGINMIDSSAEGEDYDHGGHFERSTTNRINKNLLNCGDEHSLKVIRPLSKEGWTWPACRRAQTLVSELETTYGDWGFKDPRTCLTYSFWRERLGEHKVVCVYRDPEEIVSHYLRESPSGLVKVDVTKAVRILRAWCIYNGQILRYSRDSDRPWIALSYSEFMKSDELFARLRSFVGRDLRDKRLDTHYRSRKGHRLRYHLAKILVKRIYGFDVDSIHKGLEQLAHPSHVV